MVAYVILAFVSGFLFGGLVGIVVMASCAIAHESDEAAERWPHG
jgi:hypothetical protein